MIEVRNLRKVYGETVAVDGISFEVPEGEILGFLGPNGAGKTTTMRILTGFTPPTSGGGSIGGYDVAAESSRVRGILGYLPENAPVYGEMTVESFVSFFAELKGLGRSERRSAVGLALEECGLKNVAGRLLMNLSKGYRQRAALAQALVGDPRVLILDEPTVGLDPKQIREIRSLIGRMAKRRTVILSTHILPEVSLTCTRVVIIDRGKVVADGTPDRLHSRVGKPNRLVAVVRGPEAPVRERLESVRGVREVEGVKPSGPRAKEAKETQEASRVHEFRVTARDERDLRPDLARAIVEGGYDLLELRSTGMNLEDVFLHTIASGEAGEAAERKRKRD